MDKPNILILMCDHLSKEAILSEHCPTPNFDKLRAKGVLYDKAYTTNAICSPARASLMTGLLPHNHGVLTVTHTMREDQCVLRKSRHFAEGLKEKGYHTAYFGKWHVEHDQDPSVYGWDYDFSGESSNFKEEYEKEGISKPNNYIWSEDGSDKYLYDKKVFYGVVDQSHDKRSDGFTVRHALGYMKEYSGNEPLCTFVSLNAPHDPYICGKEHYDKIDVENIPLSPSINDDLQNRPGLYKVSKREWEDMSVDEHRKAKACYYGMISEIDTAYGKLIDCVKDTNTVIILTTDHGDHMGDHGLYCKNVHAGEGVYNIPLVISAPNGVKGEVSDARVGLHDLAQTILEIAGAKQIDCADSFSFADTLNDTSIKYPTGFAEYEGCRIRFTQRIVYNENLKFVFNGFDESELYDLDEDPHEMINLIDNPDRKEDLLDMCRLFWQYVKKTGDDSLFNSQYPPLRVAPFGPDVLD